GAGRRGRRTRPRGAAARRGARDRRKLSDGSLLAVRAALLRDWTRGPFSGTTGQSEGSSPRKLREGGHMLLVHHRRGLRGLGIAAGALLVALACGTTQGTNNATAQNVPGVTDTSITIGTTTPLSGAASAYASISAGATAYFKYLNDKGGING